MNYNEQGLDGCAYAYTASFDLLCISSCAYKTGPKEQLSDSPIYLYSLMVFKQPFGSIGFGQTQRMNKYFVLYQWPSALILTKLS